MNLSSKQDLVASNSLAGIEPFVLKHFLRAAYARV